ncbi:MAG TPA: 23S rRNA (adenine(2503)-C(2))-methyltransferase RlmN [Gemmataceae bacterium]|nr:23S rRNA (adenine(2503)-C(2))-methyltransferase RlmN [Gemmataceae bacterium]
MLPVIDPPAPAVPVRRGALDLTAMELREWLEQRGQPALRARQIRRWIVVMGAESFEQMTDLPKDLRQDLAAAFVPLASQVDLHQRAADDTHKLLLRLTDGRRIECVLIQEGSRRTACISTQVGCGMGCVFCASGLNGVERNLTTAEIVEQLLRLRNLPPASRERERPELPARLTHIVVMGMGEPLANLDALVEALDVATAKDGLGIGARHITISTVGLPAKIRRLADLGKQYHLAVSLHAPSDALRSQIVESNAKTGIAAILDAANYFHERTNRQVTFEYVLLRDINDDATHARELALLLRGQHAHVNVIPFNDVYGLPYRRPTQEALTEFTAVLEKHGVSVKVRKRKGSEIDAACGQLRRRVEQTQ